MHRKTWARTAGARVVIDRAHFQVHRLEAAERALDDAQSLVGTAGAHDVQAIEGGFGGDGVGLAGVVCRTAPPLPWSTFAPPFSRRRRVGREPERCRHGPRRQGAPHCHRRKLRDRRPAHTGIRAEEN